MDELAEHLLAKEERRVTHRDLWGQDPKFRTCYQHYLDSDDFSTDLDPSQELPISDLLCHIFLFLPVDDKTLSVVTLVSHGWHDRAEHLPHWALLRQTHFYKVPPEESQPRNYYSYFYRNRTKSKPEFVSPVVGLPYKAIETMATGGCWTKGWEWEKKRLEYANTNPRADGTDEAPILSRTLLVQQRQLKLKQSFDIYAENRQEQRNAETLALRHQCLRIIAIFVVPVLAGLFGIGFHAPQLELSLGDVAAIAAAFYVAGWMFLPLVLCPCGIFWSKLKGEPYDANAVADTKDLTQFWQRFAALLLVVFVSLSAARWTYAEEAAATPVLDVESLIVFLETSKEGATTSSSSNNYSTLFHTAPSDAFVVSWDRNATTPHHHHHQVTATLLENSTVLRFTTKPEGSSSSPRVLYFQVATEDCAATLGGLAQFERKFQSSTFATPWAYRTTRSLPGGGFWGAEPIHLPTAPNLVNTTTSSNNTGSVGIEETIPVVATILPCHAVGLLHNPLETEVEAMETWTLSLVSVGVVFELVTAFIFVRTLQSLRQHRQEVHHSLFPSTKAPSLCAANSKKVNLSSFESMLDSTHDSTTAIVHIETKQPKTPQQVADDVFLETALLTVEGREVNERDRTETEAMLALGQRKDRYDYQRYTEDKYKRPAHEKPKALNHYLSLGLVVTWYVLLLWLAIVGGICGFAGPQLRYTGSMCSLVGFPDGGYVLFGVGIASIIFPCGLLLFGVDSPDED